MDDCPSISDAVLFQIKSTIDMTRYLNAPQQQINGNKKNDYTSTLTIPKEI